jgi:hypothetical protein
MSTTERKYREAEDEYKRAYEDLLEEYGNATNVPSHRQQYISEILRAKYILARFPDEEPTQLLSKYLVVPSIASKFAGARASDGHIKKGKSKRENKHQAIINWCKENVGTETTVYQIAEVGEVSYPTANNFIKNRPDLFTKMKKGSYIVRDPETERALEKK